MQGSGVDRMSIETGLQNFVATDPDIAAIIVHDNLSNTELEHMFPVVASEKAVLPYIIYRRTAASRPTTMSGTTGHVQPTFELTCWATTYDVAIDLADKVRIRLHGKKATLSGVVVEHMFVTNETDTFDPSPELKEKQVFGRELTVELQYEE